MNHRGHFALVISNFSANFRLPGVVTVGLNVTAEKAQTTGSQADMSNNRDGKLRAVRNLVFVVWDTDRDRGWLLFGDAVALHLLRIVIGDTLPPEKFDFASSKILKDVADSDAPAYEVLNTFNNEKTSLNRIAKGYSDSDNEEEKQLKESIGQELDTIYGQLFKLREDEQKIKMDQDKQLSGYFKTWYEEKWGTTLRGWDFKSLACSRQLVTSVQKLRKDPGWLKMARQLGAIFLLEKGFGEFLEPRAGSCCPYFPALPAGKGFLACGMEAVGRLIRWTGGSDECDTPENTVARLSYDQGWEHDLDPFARPNCQGDHISTLDPSCFPVQQIRDAKYVKSLDKRLQTDMKLIKGKSLYTKKEVQLMINQHPKGVVVFGRQPSSEELKEICRRNGHRATQNAKATGAEPLNRPLSRGSTQCSTGKAPTPAPIASPGRPSTASSQRTPSLDSIRRAVPNTQSRASGTTTAAGQLRASTRNSSAALVHKAASNASLRSTGSNMHHRVSPGSSTGAGQLQSTASQTPAASLPRPASNASLRSTGSTAHPRTSNGGPSRSRESGEENLASKTTRKPSNSSVRTASSVASRATAGSQSQKPPPQPSATDLEKTITNSSDKTTSSHSSRTTQNSAAGSTTAKNRQRQLLEKSVSTTVAAGTLAPGQPVSSNHGTNSGASTENPPTTSSGPAHTSSGGPEGSS